MTPRFAFISAAGRRWIDRCHPQTDVRDAVAAQLRFHVEMLCRLGGTYRPYGGSPIRKLQTVEDVWELRVHTSAGNFRQFFRFAMIGGREAIVLVEGAHKKGASLPRETYRTAGVRLDRFVRQLQADRSLQDRTRYP